VFGVFYGYFYVMCARIIHEKRQAYKNYFCFCFCFCFCFYAFYNIKIFYYRIQRV